MAKVATLKPETVTTIKEEISEPNFKTVQIGVVGVSQLVMHKFSRKVLTQMEEKHKAGSTARNKKIREAKDFEALYQESMHTSDEGWHGIPCGAFRQAMIRACSLCGFKMTQARMTFDVLADGYDKDDGGPLVRIYGEPDMFVTMARVETGQPDVRVRARWKKWSCIVQVEYDADSFTHRDIINLLMRVGRQVGVLEGRNSSKNSAGMGWGKFRLAGEEDTQKIMQG